MRLLLESAIKELSTCIRDECRDHVFNDREITWVNPNSNDIVAMGYASSSEHYVHFTHKPTLSFKGDEAQKLISAGIAGSIQRNDTTGSNVYQGN